MSSSEVYMEKEHLFIPVIWQSSSINIHIQKPSSTICIWFFNEYFLSYKDKKKVSEHREFQCV